ncbi:MAG: YggS family pyridoxal phosphate-dependent enzyme [archaeon]|nr:YggS family pyridoxal phosphate-dependent enzyme [archaeon]
MNNILDNYNNIVENINNIKKENNINYDINLLAVSKTKPIEDIYALKNNDINFFGENYVQELTAKYDEDNSINFHMIGHLQTNKVKNIVDKVSMIESVDSIKLLKEIDKESKKKNIISNVLFEVNVALEDSKFGFKVEEVEAVIEEAKNYSHVNVCGLMTSAPYTNAPEENIIYFKKLKSLYDDIKNKNDNIDNNINFNTLSMGMSNDYKEAILSGSNEIRIGTDIFGKRNYNK